VGVVAMEQGWTKGTMALLMARFIQERKLVS
jgi:hypothetical protein